MKRSNYIYLVLVFMMVDLFCVDIGSDTAVNRFTTQQVLNDGDRIATFASLQAGFILDNGLVLGTFDTVFPVSGMVALNFGTLTLNQDFIFHNMASITQFGSIVGNNHILEFSKTMTAVAEQSVSGNSCSVRLITTTPLAQNVLSVAWSADDQYVAAGLQTVAGNDLVVYQWNGTSLTLKAGIDLANNVLSVDWHPTTTTHWIAAGRFGAVGAPAAELYNLSYSGTTVTTLSSVDIGAAGTGANSVKWHPNGTHVAVGLANSELRVYPVNSAGIFDTPVTVTLSQDPNSVSWNTAGNYLAVGTDVGAAWNELRVYAFTASPLALTLNASLDIGQTINEVSWNKTVTNNDIIAIGLLTSTDRLRIYRHASGLLTNLPTTLALATVVNTLSWNGDCLLAGLNANASTELRRYSFASDTLTFQEGLEVGSNVNRVRWSHDARYAATGDNANNLTIYRRADAFVDKSSVNFSNLGILFNNDITFKNCSINFIGDCFINGQNHVLTFDSSCTFTIQEDSTLQFSNITLKDLTDQQITCSDNTGTLILDNVNIELGGDFQWTKGSITIEDEVAFRGNATIFSYQSTHTLTIEERSSLLIDQNVTFSYDTNDSGLLVMKQATSELILNGGTLHASLSGLDLTKGSLVIQDNSAMACEVYSNETQSAVTIIDNGITLGNSNLADDIRLIMLYNIQLEFLTGSLNYRNKDNDSFKVIAASASIRMDTSTTFRLYEDLVFRFGLLIMADNTTLEILKDKTLTGSLSPEGSLRRIAIPESLT